MASSALKADNNDASTEQKFRQHDMLLYKIAAGFDLDSSERYDLVEEVHSYATRHASVHEGLLPTKVWLAKLMVHKCVFTISSRLFQQPETSTKQMPLSFRTAYLLNNLVGFNEAEIAAILNTTPLKIKERLCKAFLFLQRNR
jgi:hypothetical protein